MNPTNPGPVLGDLMFGELPVGASCPPGWTRGETEPTVVCKTMTDWAEWTCPPYPIRLLGWLNPTGTVYVDEP